MVVAAAVDRGRAAVEVVAATGNSVDVAVDAVGIKGRVEPAGLLCKGAAPREAAGVAVVDCAGRSPSPVPPVHHQR